MLLKQHVGGATFHSKLGSNINCGPRWGDCPGRGAGQATHPSPRLPSKRGGLHQKITWHGTSDKGFPNHPLNLWVARCKARGVGVRTGMLLTRGAAPGNSAAHPENAWPPIPGFPSARAADRAVVPLTSARSCRGCRALLRPAPATPLTSPPSPNSHLSRR